LFDACHGGLEFLVGKGGLFLQGIEGGVIKNAPPGAFGDVVPRFRRFPSPVIRCLDGGALVIRSDDASAQAEQEEGDGEARQEPTPTKFRQV
jgi:hypothetical protein